MTAKWYIVALGFALLCSLEPARSEETPGSIVAVTSVVYPGQPLDGTGTVQLTLRRALPASAGIAITSSDLSGKVASRTILPNKPIPLSYLRESFLVEAGKPVRVVYRQGAIQIELTGQALGAGSAGDVVRVRNASSGVTLTGVVSGQAEVMVARQ